MSLETYNIADFVAYIKLIYKTDIYQHTANSLSKEFIESIASKSNEYAFEDSIRNTVTNKTETKGYKSLRAYCKTLTLGNSLERIKQIKNTSPKAVNKFVHHFKYCKVL